MEIIEVEIEDKKQELTAPVADWRTHAAFNRKGLVRFQTGARK